MQVRFVFDRATKNTLRFDEVPEDGKPPVVGTLYVQKWAVPAGVKALVVNIEVTE